MQKKGELTSAQIVILVIAIIGFVIVLIFLLSPELIGQSEEEICRLSILERATLPTSAQSYTPLKCTTNKICLSLGDDCPQFVGEKNIEKIKLSDKKSEESARTIEKITAESMFDCWSLTGRGRLSLFTGGESALFNNLFTETFSIENAEARCLICSRVALSPQLQTNNEILNNVNVNRYLKEEKVPGSSLTFLQTFTDRQVNSYPSDFTEEFVSVQKRTDQIAIIFSQMKTSEKDALEEAVRTGTNTGIAIGGSLLTQAGGVIKLVVGGKAIIGLGAIAMITSGVSTYFQAKENQALTAAYCGQFAGESGLFGCSIVSSVDYNNVQTINQLCKAGIEGTITTPSGLGGSF